MNKSVVIAMVCDEGFAMPTCVAIQSLKENRNKKTEYKIYVFANKCEEDSLKRISVLSEDGLEVVVSQLEELPRQCDFFDEKLSATPTALYKFDLPELLPEEDKVLYLDGDILIMKDLTEVYDTEIGEYYVAAVKDMPLMQKEKTQMQILMQVEENYFNSGVMLLNLKKMRDDNITKKLWEYKRCGTNIFMDQDAFNVIFAGKVKYISFYYNMVFRVVENHDVDRICHFYELPLECDIEGLYRKATILHLASKHKPWKKDTPYLTSLYEKYYYCTEYKDQPLLIENRVPPLLKVRCIPETSESENSLVICKDDFQLFQTIRFIQCHRKDDLDIVLSPVLKKYEEILQGVGLFRDVYILKLTNDDLDAEGRLTPNAISKSAVFEKDYGLIYYYNIDDIYSLIFYHQVQRGIYAKVICLDGGLESYLNNFKKPQGKGYGCNIYDYISIWYSDDCAKVQRGDCKDYVYPMPRMSGLKESVFAKIFTLAHNDKRIILEWSDVNIIHQVYLVYKHIIEIFKESILVVTPNERLHELCNQYGVPYTNCLQIPSLDVLYRNEKLTVFTDCVTNEYQLLWSQYSNIEFVDISRLLLDDKRIQYSVDGWFESYNNYYILKEWRQLEELLDVMKGR